MPVLQCVERSIYRTFSLPLCLSLSLYLFIYLFVSLFLCISLSTSLSFCLSLSLSLSLFTPFSVPLFLCFPVSLSPCLSVSLSLYFLFKLFSFTMSPSYVKMIFPPISYFPPLLPLSVFFLLRLFVCFSACPMIFLSVCLHFSLSIAVLWTFCPCFYNPLSFYQLRQWWRLLAANGCVTRMLPSKFPGFLYKTVAQNKVRKCEGNQVFLTK